MATLLVMRHGESTADLEDRIGGSYDDDLTDLGREQARRLAARIAAQYRLSALYVSTLKRALQTAEAITAATGVPATPDDRLREMATGAIAGLTRTEASRRFPVPRYGWTIYTTMPEGESQLDQLRRVADFYLGLKDEILRAASQPTPSASPPSTTPASASTGTPAATSTPSASSLTPAIAILAHGGTIRWLLRLILGLPVDTHVQFDAGDTCLYEFDLTAHTTRVRRTNDTSHLLHPPLTP